MSAFIFYLASLGAIVSASMLLPALVAFAYSEIETGYRILMYGAIGGFFCTAILMSIFGRVGGLERNTAILLAVTSWIIIPLGIAVPLSDLAGLGFVDAVFQSMSVFTTTGADIFENPQTVPKSVLFMLAQFQWLGGFATLITFVLVLAPWEIGGLPQVSSASIAASIVASQNRLIEFCAGMFRVYSGFTIVCLVFLLLCGLKPYEATIFSFAALSTGGVILPVNELDLLLGNSGMLVVAFFMLVGATSIFWHAMIYELDFRRLAKHRESYIILAVFVFFSIYIAWLLVSAAGSIQQLPLLTALSEGAFNAASMISTSAIQSRPGVFSLLPPTLLLMMVLMGAGSYSTSSGIRYFRIGGIFMQSRHELDRLVYPNIQRSSRFGSTLYDLQFMKAVWSLFVVLIGTLGISTLGLSLNGLGFQQSFTAAVAALSNAGPMYGSFWDAGTSDQWPSYFHLGLNQKLILIVTMLLGRLEVIAVFASIMVFIRSLR